MKDCGNATFVLGLRKLRRIYLNTSKLPILSLLDISVKSVRNLVVLETLLELTNTVNTAMLSDVNVGSNKPSRVKDCSLWTMRVLYGRKRRMCSSALGAATQLAQGSAFGITTKPSTPPVRAMFAISAKKSARPKMLSQFTNPDGTVSNACLLIH